MLVQGLVDQFFAKSKVTISTSENFNEFVFVANGKGINVPHREEFSKLLDKFPSRDRVLIDVTLESLDPLTITKEHLIEDLDELNSIVTISEEDEIYELKITIIKNELNSCFSVYSFSDFIKYLQGLTFENILLKFSCFLRKNNYIVFETLDGTKVKCNTQTIYFNCDPDSIKVNNEDRISTIDRRNGVSNFSNSLDILLLPDDFKLMHSSNLLINNFFNRLANFMSLVFIADNSTIIESNILDIKISGYRLINDRLDFSRYQYMESEIYEIYNWIYDGGNLSDKIGLARNIITLNYLAKDPKIVKENTFNSIKSSFAIYLKENVQQYIDVTSRMSEHLLNFSLKVNDVFKTFGNSFKSNNFMVITFFLSIIVFNSLSARNFSDMFTGDVTFISAVILLVSTAYLFVSIYLTYKEVSKFENDYNKLKSIYDGLLNPEDIKKIFDESFIKENVKYVMNKVIAFSIVWGIEIVFLAIAVFFLSR